MKNIHDYPLKLNWLKALYKGDCLDIETLLRTEPGLVNIYPVVGAPSDFPTHCSGWRGCSALHIAVKRGWPFLAQKIVNIFIEKPQSSNTSVGGTSESQNGFTLKMLEKLLLAVDTDYQLDALALAVVNGNELIVKILTNASSVCKNNPYQARSSSSVPRVAVDPSDTGFRSSSNLRTELWPIIEEILGADLNHEIVSYKRNNGYNFLPEELFFLHHLMSEQPNLLSGKQMYRDFWQLTGEIIQKSQNKNVLIADMFSLQDGRGKTIAHVFAETSPVYCQKWPTSSFVPNIFRTQESQTPFEPNWSCTEWERFIEVCDGVGRTVAHELVHHSKNLPNHQNELIRYFLVGDAIKQFSKKCKWMNKGLFHYFDLDALCTRNGYTSQTFHVLEDSETFHESSALHHASLHDYSAPFVSFIELQNSMSFTPKWSEACSIRRRKGNSKVEKLFPDHFRHASNSFTILQVAAMCRSTSVVRALLKVDEAFDCARIKSTAHGDTSKSNGQLSILFIAAGQGDPCMIQAILASEKFDSLITTSRSKDTALHFAANADYNGNFLEPTLFDLVNVSHQPGLEVPHSFRFGRSEKKDMIQTADSRRKGCINLLLQSGIDIWQPNKDGNIADPGQDASSDFCLWWYEKIAKETQDLKGGLKAAANAISVTAALVATASFVGPLQPPLGYAGKDDRHPDMLQVDNVSVRIFVVCDTLALYLALVAIMLSLMPLLPLPKESLLDELSHVRKIVTAAVAFLIVSIVLFLVGFAAGSIAVIPDNGLWNSGGLTISTVVVGGVFCLYMMYLFLLRLARLIWHENTWLRRHYRTLSCFQ